MCILFAIFHFKIFNFLQENESAAKIAKAANLRQFSEGHRLAIEFSVGDHVVNKNTVSANKKLI